MTYYTSLFGEAIFFTVQSKRDRCFNELSINIVTLLTIVEKPDVPEAPLEATDISKDTVTLSWKPSPKDGGSPITAYIVESRDSWKAKWMPAGKTEADTCTFTVDKLKEKQEYYFRVCAENVVGKSDYLETPKAITPKSKFGKLKWICATYYPTVVFRNCRKILRAKLKHFFYTKD